MANDENDVEQQGVNFAVQIIESNVRQAKCSNIQYCYINSIQSLFIQFNPCSFNSIPVVILFNPYSFNSIF